MSIMSFKKNREKTFPKIKDFSDPLDAMRYEKDVGKLSYSDWFWFHPSAYKVMRVGSPIVSGVLFWIGFIFGVIYHLFIVKIICLIFGLLLSYGSYIKIKEMKTFDNVTFFDMYIRETSEMPEVSQKGEEE